MEICTFESVGVGKAPEPFGYRIVMELRAVPAVDDPALADPHVACPGGRILLIGAGFVQQGHHARRERDKARSGIGLGRPLKASICGRVFERAGDVDGAVVPVYIAEAQGAQQGQQQGATVAHYEGSAAVRRPAPR